MSHGFESYGLQIIRNIPICCAHCGYEFFISTDEIEWDENHENAPMGIRVNYIFFGKSICPRCGQQVSFTQEASEYPEGAIENINPPECLGGDVLQPPEIKLPYYDDDLYVSIDPIYPRHLNAKPTSLNLNDKLIVDVVDGDAYIGEQLYVPNKRTTLWINPAGRLLPILVEETGSIRFDDNRAVFAEILQKNPERATMRLLGKIAEAVIVRNCRNDAGLNRAWLSKARRNRTIQKMADTFQAVGTGLHSTKRRYPHKYNPSDTQRDIIWINDMGMCALVAGGQSTAGMVAGLQVKVSGNGLNYILKSLTNLHYEVPLVYFPMADDFEFILDRANLAGLVVESGVDFIDVREIDTDAFYEIKDYYPLLLDLFTGRLTGEAFVREASRITPIRNGIIAASLSMPKSDVRIVH